MFANARNSEVGMLHTYDLGYLIAGQLLDN